jgi:hypothetical protein
MSTAPGFDELMAEVMSHARHFGHREHVHLTWLAVRQTGTSAAVRLVSDGIQRTARYAGAPQKYHATVSRAWVELVGHHADQDGGGDFELFASNNQELLDKRLLMRFYRSATLASLTAKTGWVEPDLRPFRGGQGWPGDVSGESTSSQVVGWPCDEADPAIASRAMRCLHAWKGAQAWEPHEGAVDRPYHPASEVAVALLVPHPRSLMGLEQLQLQLDGRRGVVSLGWLCGVEPDVAQMFGADEAVLLGRDDPDGGTVVAVQRLPVQVLGEEHVGCEGVFDHHDRGEAVETFEGDVGDGRTDRDRRLDDQAEEVRERYPFPVQVDGGPSGNAMEVGRHLPTRQMCQCDHRQIEWLEADTADSDRRIAVNRRRAAGNAEAREPFDATLAGWKRHVPHPIRSSCQISTGDPR